MDRLKEDFNKAEKMLNKAQKHIENMNLFLDRSDYVNLSEECKKYQQISEKIVNQSRLLPLTLGYNNAITDIEDIVLEENQIKINKVNNKWFHIVMPVLLNKKENGNPTYIRTSLFYALRDYFKNNYENKIEEKSVIIFKHNYSKDRPYREMRDHDNIELNSVVDLVAMFMLTDDNPLYLDHYYFSTNSENEDSTEVFLVPKKDFIEFLNFIIGGDSSWQFSS